MESPRSAIPSAALSFSRRPAPRRNPTCISKTGSAFARRGMMRCFLRYALRRSGYWRRSSPPQPRDRHQSLAIISTTRKGSAAVPETFRQMIAAWPAAAKWIWINGNPWIRTAPGAARRLHGRAPPRGPGLPARAFETRRHRRDRRPPASSATVRRRERSVRRACLRDRRQAPRHACFRVTNGRSRPQAS